MPDYTIRDPRSGRTVTIRGDSPPTEAELQQIFARINNGPPQTAPLPAAATAGMMAQSTVESGDPAVSLMDVSPTLRGVRDVAGGVRAGLARTIYGGGDLIRRGLGMERVVDRPAVQAAMTPPESAMGQAGYLVEQAAEFAVPLTRMSRAMQSAGLLRRSVAEGAASAGVAGVQSGGEPSEMMLAGTAGATLPFVARSAGAVGRAAQRAAAGATEGGLGGAIAAGVRTVAPSEPRTLLIQAIKPRAVRVNFARSLGLAMPELKAAEQTIGKPIASIDTLLDATTAAKQNLQQQLHVLRGTAQGLEIDGSGVAEAMTRSIPRKLALENPEAAQRLVASADVYRRRFSLDEMETILRETNAELDSLMAMFPRNRYAAITSNPAAAALDAQGKALRQAIDAGLDRMAAGGGTAAQALRRRYGALLEVEGEAIRRSNVAARQQPESLSEQIGAVRAAADMARGTWRVLHGDMTGAADIAAAHAGRSAGRAIKEAQTTDALIRRAFEDYTGTPSPVPMPTRRPVRGTLGPGPRVGVAAETSGGGGVRARSAVQRDPRTGRMRRVYLSGTE